MTPSHARTLAWLALAGILFVTVSPIGLRPHDFLPVNIDRAGAFALMAFLFVIAYPRHWLLCGILIMVGAAGIEALQLLSPTRHARFDDALIKAVGAAIGCLAGRAINQRLARRRPTAA
jgi:hypothetical protein